MDNMTDFLLLESMTDSQILASIRNDLIKVQNGLDNFHNDMKKVHDGMKKLQESLATALACTKEYGSVEEDGLYDVEACVCDSNCDDHQEQIFIVAEDDDLVDEANNTIQLVDELSSSVDNQVVVPYLDETRDDIVGMDDSCIDKEQFDVVGLEGTTTVVSVPLEDYDPFWSAILDSGIEARQRILVQLAISDNCHMFSQLVYALAIPLVLYDGISIIVKMMIRDYDGFNGPGNLEVAFQFVLDLVRDYDGFNGPGHTLRTMCL